MIMCCDTVCISKPAFVLAIGYISRDLDYNAKEYCNDPELHRHMATQLCTAHKHRALFL